MKKQIFFWLNLVNILIFTPFNSLNCQINPLIKKDTSLFKFELSDFSKEDQIIDKIWKTANEAGFYLGNSNKNSKLLKDGNVIITGFYQNQNINFQGHELLGNNSATNSCFIAKMDTNAKVIWIKSILANISSIGMSVEESPDGTILLAGLFNGNLNYDIFQISHDDQPDLFIASLDKNGEYKWVKQCNLNVNKDLNNDRIVSYSVSLNVNNNAEAQKVFYTTDKPYEEQGLNFDKSNNNIVFYGDINTAKSLINNIYIRTENLNLSDILFRINYKFISQNKLPKTISGLLSVISIVNDSNKIITNQVIIEALKEHNSNFGTSHKEIFDFICKIKSIYKTNGVITLNTVGRSSVKINGIEISDGATITISKINGGYNNFNVNINKGIKVYKETIFGTIYSTLKNINITSQTSSFKFIHGAGTTDINLSNILK